MDEQEDSEYLSVLPDDSYIHQVWEPLACRYKVAHIDQQQENLKSQFAVRKPFGVRDNSILEVFLEVFIFSLQ